MKNKLGDKFLEEVTKARIGVTQYNNAWKLFINKEIARAGKIEFADWLKSKINEIDLTNCNASELSLLNEFLDLIKEGLDREEKKDERRKTN